MREAFVHFRTVPNNGFGWLRGAQRRGYWRVLVGPIGAPPTLNAKGVVEIWHSPVGIRGVTERSRYYIGHWQHVANKVAAKANRLLLKGHSVEEVTSTLFPTKK